MRQVRESFVLFRQIRHLLDRPRDTWTEEELSLVREYQRLAKQELRAGLPQSGADRRSNPEFRAWMNDNQFPWAEYNKYY